MPYSWSRRTVLPAAHELSHSFLSKFAGQPCHRAHEMLVDCVVWQVGDKAAVDLQVVNGKLLQVEEGRKADAEVVEGELRSQAPRVDIKRRALLEVTDHRALGDFKNQVRWIGPRGGELSLDHWQKLVVGKSFSGEIHREPQVATECRLLSDQVYCLAYHPAVDQVDQTGALGDG